jgi:hypothetical protein
MKQDLLLALGFSEKSVAAVMKVYDEGIQTKLSRKGSASNVNIPRVKSEA